jgi:hypothetical protein
MPSVVMKQSHEFDLLNQWASLPDDEVEKLITTEAIATLQRVIELLSDESKPKAIVDRGNFVLTVREMRKLYSVGSRLLGEAILEASGWMDKQEPIKAKESYERFLSSCVSKFYRDIARHQLQKIP